MAKKNIEPANKECNCQSNEEIKKHLETKISAEAAKIISNLLDDLHEYNESLTFLEARVEELEDRILLLESDKPERGPVVYNVFEASTRKGGLPLEYYTIKKHFREINGEEMD